MGVYNKVFTLNLVNFYLKLGITKHYQSLLCIFVNN